MLSAVCWRAAFRSAVSHETWWVTVSQSLSVSCALTHTRVVVVRVTALFS